MPLVCTKHKLRWVRDILTSWMDTQQHYTSTQATLTSEDAMQQKRHMLSSVHGAMSVALHHLCGKLHGNATLTQSFP